MFIKNLTILMNRVRISREYNFFPFSGIYNSAIKIDKGNKYKPKTDYHYDYCKNKT